MAEGTRKRNAIEKDLKKQLEAKGNTGKFFLDLVEDYMRLWDLKNKLFEDISDRGIVSEYNNGGGQKGTKQNESILAVLRVSERMTKILDNLGIRPSTDPVFDDDEQEL